jgi:hypothetical protein
MFPPFLEHFKNPVDSVQSVRPEEEDAGVGAFGFNDDADIESLFTLDDRGADQKSVKWFGIQVVV